MNTRQRVVAVLSTITATGMIAATTPAFARADSNVTLHILWSTSGPGLQALKNATADYTKSHPNVQFQIDTGDELTKFRIAAAGGNPPDIVHMDSVFTNAFGQAGQFADLSKFGAKTLASKFIPSTWTTVASKQGAVYGLPFDANTIVLQYNKKLFAAAGISKPPTTFDELVSDAKLIKQKTGKWGYEVPTSPQSSGWLQYQFLTWVWREGGEVLNSSWTKAIYNDAAGVQALTLLTSLGKDGVVPKNQYDEGGFYNGNYGMIDDGSWKVPDFSNNTGGEKTWLGFAPMPTLKKGVPNYADLGLYNLSVAAQSQHQQQAYDFIKFITTTPKYQLAYEEPTGLMPSLKSEVNDPFYKKYPWPIFMQALENSKERPPVAAWPEIATDMGNALQAALSGLQTPKQALDTSVQRDNQALAGTH